MNTLFFSILNIVRGLSPEEFIICFAAVILAAIFIISWIFPRGHYTKNKIATWGNPGGVYYSEKKGWKEYRK